jgi:hypothetical protein
VLLEWSSTRARRPGTNETGLAEKMEAYLGEAMEKGLVLDAALAQNEAQARAFWAIRENHSEGQKREGPSIKHDISVSVSRIAGFMAEGLAAMKKALPDCRPVVFGHVGDGKPALQLPVAAGLEQGAVHGLPPCHQRPCLRPRGEQRRLDFGRAWHRPPQGRGPRPLPQQGRTGHDAHHQARAGSAEPDEPGEDPPRSEGGSATL